jgi:MAF protein
MMQQQNALTDNPVGIVLASTSPFRKELLQRLGLSFATDSPEIDESSQPGETPDVLVSRLSLEKAQAVATRHPNCLVIGSDQVACNEGRILGKPGNRENAITQLTEAAGKKITFFTGLTLLDTRDGSHQTLCEPFHVHFRALNREQIERYVDAETPFNCAGSFKSEGLGISLFNKLEGDDPNALIGLPLIRLIALLEKHGVMVP